MRDLLPPPLRELPQHPALGPPPLDAPPSVIVGSSSGGNDSNTAVLYARWRWPEVPIIIWHALLDEMDWEQTPAFAMAARNGQPPTARIRWCTHYFKIALFDAWARRNRQLLGDRPLLITGEHWRESPSRERRLTSWEWRDALTLQPGHAEHPTGWRLLWLRPVIDWAWHQFNTYVHACGVPFHPGYFAQGETRESIAP